MIWAMPCAGQASTGGETQPQLAHAAGISVPTLWQIERHTRGRLASFWRMGSDLQDAPLEIIVSTSVLCAYGRRSYIQALSGGERSIARRLHRQFLQIAW